jgi:mannosyltransferase
MSETQSPRWQRLDSIIALTATVAAGFLRFHALDRKSFWLDEGVSVEIARLDWYNFVRLMWRREANMSLYYLLLRAWQHLGGSEFFLRSLSALLSVATVPLLYWLGLKLFNRRVAGVASLLLAANAYGVRYAQEARSYSLYVFLGTLSWIFFFSYMADFSAQNRRAYICFSTLAVYAHFYFAFFIVAQWLAARLHSRNQPPSNVAATFRWIAAFTFPAFLFAATTGVGPLRWVPRPGARDVYLYYEHMAGNAGLPLLLASGALIALALWPVARSLVARSSDFLTWRYQSLLLWALCPIILVLALSLARPLFVARYMIVCQPAFLLLVAAGIDRLPRNWLRFSAAILLLALSLGGTRAYYDQDFDLERDDYRAATNYVLNHSRPGDVLMFDLAQARMPYEYYRSIYRGSNTAPLVVYPAYAASLSYRDFMGKPANGFLKTAVDQHERVWVILKTSEGSGAQDSSEQQSSDTTGATSPITEQAHFPGVIVRLYSRDLRE